MANTYDKVFTFYQSVKSQNRFSPNRGNYQGSYGLDTLVDSYLPYDNFRFILVLMPTALKSEVILSVLREHGSHYFEIAQLVDDKMINDPVFNHDGYGIVSIEIEGLQEFINGIGR